MTTSISEMPDLTIALEAANKALYGDGFTVEASNKAVAEPVYLQIRHADGLVRKIGITHLVHLEGSNWEKNFKTTDEVTKAIITRVRLFFQSAVSKLYIDVNGTIFDFNKTEVTILKDGTFSIDGTVVTYKDEALLLTSIKSEGVIKFNTLTNGDIRLEDGVDNRPGKGIVIDSSGKIDRR